MVNSADKIPNEGIEYVQRTKFKLKVIAWKFTMYNVKKKHNEHYVIRKYDN